MSQSGDFLFFLRKRRNRKDEQRGRTDRRKRILFKSLSLFLWTLSVISELTSFESYHCLENSFDHTFKVCLSVRLVKNISCCSAYPILLLSCFVIGRLFTKISPVKFTILPAKEFNRVVLPVPEWIIVLYILLVNWKKSNRANQKHVLLWT